VSERVEGPAVVVVEVRSRSSIPSDLVGIECTKGPDEASTDLRVDVREDLWEVDVFVRRI
jgi:hypothetical protein